MTYLFYDEMSLKTLCSRYSINYSDIIVKRLPDGPNGETAFEASINMEEEVMYVFGSTYDETVIKLIKNIINN